MKKKKVPIIAAILSIIIVAIVVLYIMFADDGARDFRDGQFRDQQFRGASNFSLDDETINEVVVFFDSTSDIEEINSYCEENRTYCRSYCKQINTEHEICEQLSQPPEGVDDRRDFPRRR